jgi:adenosylmethionine-8-amino-7-oxononanoate aminotransferase
MGDYRPDTATSLEPAALETPKQSSAPHSQSSVLYHQLRQPPLNIVGGRGSYLITDSGQEILDATCGAAVSCLGHSDTRVHEAIMEQLQKVPYTYSLYFTNSAAEELSKILVDSTGGKMSRAFIVSSGKNFQCGLSFPRWLISVIVNGRNRSS